MNSPCPLPFIDAAEPVGPIAAAEDIVAAARAGRMVILIDDVDRENEGDLVIPADAVDAGIVTFMAREACGLVCVAIDGDTAARLALPPMTRRATDPMRTAFTVSIEARHGVTTGISAADRARTVAVVADPASGPDDVVMPGHLFPVVAREGGLLVREGHTEAAVDLARLAGRGSAGVICEIMNADGTMARLPDLLVFARRHGLLLGTIADLVAYRRETGLP